MIYAYIGKNKKLCLRPADPEGEKELREFLQQLKQLGLEAIDVETEMAEENYEHYKRHKHHGAEYAGNKEFGFQPKSYFPMPPDFSPEAHRPYPPFFLPFWLGDDNGYGSRDGRGGRGRDGRGRSRYGEGDGGRRGRGGRGRDGEGGGSRAERYIYPDDDDFDETTR